MSLRRDWRGTGPTFDLPDWGGRLWRIDLDGPDVGLRCDDASPGLVLGLDGVAAAGRSDRLALGGGSLSGFESRPGWVRATYLPEGWDGLGVRATWSLAGDSGVDLEVQLWASSVGRLDAVEIGVRSGTVERHPAGPRSVEPRDPRAAALTYDGREPDLAGLTTGPLRNPDAPRGGLGPIRFGVGGAAASLVYVEFAHPGDVARRIVAGGSSEFARSALFGHDLEKGVVLRGRLRGLWLPAETQPGEILDRYDAFLGEPLPLGT